MTPERWNQIDELFQEVLAQPLAERTATLDATCRSDQALRHEVETLLRYREQARSFLEVPALEASAALICERALKSMTGQIIGPYKIEQPLGTGGMGEVYLAENTNLEGKVAIKFLPPYLQADETARQRLIREARAVARLDHPNICSVYDVKQEGDYSFIVMPYVPGETLAEHIKKGTLQLSQVLDIAIKIVEALEEAHSREIVHRDIKPGNIMITPRGQVKVLDFGLAKLLGPQVSERAAKKSRILFSQPGDRPGTPPYMAPEQAWGRSVDARGDLFAVGVILYECIAGRRPFVGQTTAEILDQVKNVDPPAPSTLNPELPLSLDVVTLKALAKRPVDRYQTAAELLFDLRRLQAGLDNNDQLVTVPDPPNAQTFSSSDRHDRYLRLYLSLAAMVILCVVAAYVLYLVIKSVRVYQPAATAVRHYDIGTIALRNGAYLEASQALQQAIAADDRFALAHARLAEAYTELDYSDKAKDEIIRAQTLANELRLSKSDSLYLKATSATVLRDFAPAVESYRQIAQQTGANEKAHVYFELGKAYEKNDELTKAKESYETAAELAPQEAAPFLRLGIVYGELQDFPSAERAFDKAESIFQALGNDEGVTEVFYQRGFQLLARGRLPETKTQLESALRMAAITGNFSQRIRALQALSSVSALDGHVGQAEQQATEAIQMARANNVENQTAGGLISLGNAFLTRGDYAEAENYYQQGLGLAEREKMRLDEAWARQQLGSLRSLQHKTDEALSFIEPAAAFFRQGGYRKWSSYTSRLLGRIYRDKGDYEAALRAFNELHQLGEQLDDQLQVGLSDIDIGNVFAYREQYPEALKRFDESYTILESLKAEVQMAYAAHNRANMLWQLGYFERARSNLDKAAAIATRETDPKQSYRQLLAEVHLSRALIELSEGHFPRAINESRRTLDLTADQYVNVTIQAKEALALAQARGGVSRGPQNLCAETIKLAEQLADPQLVTGAVLACSETYLKTGDPQSSLKAALQAAEYCARLSKLDSLWRAWLIAAQASMRLGKELTAREYAANADKQLAEIERSWGTEAYRSYLARADIAGFHKQLQQILSD